MLPAVKSCFPILPTYAVSIKHAGRWKLPPPAAIRYC